MKTVLMIIAGVFITAAALATPISIGIGLWDWVGNDMEFKFALWEGFKTWVIMIVGGLGIGLPCYVAATK